MTYAKAIQMALSGDERGYTFLYEETYKSKMYLAIQYMKNEDDAMDILQDAYVKAFAKLDTLQDPEKFPSWFGMIVANTAKNALVKKNPVLFTDISTDPDAEPFEYSIEDEDVSRQPELSYTSEETRLLVREMMDALSEEQRVCVLMFHIDGIPIKEIAETLGCSENTVKSRLNYARKNIKKQGEELQKKGYQLYGIAPFTLLLLLLHKDAYAMYGEAEFISAGAKVEQAIFQNGSSFAGEAAGNALAGESAGTAAAGDAAGTGAGSSVAGNAAAGTAAKTAAGAAVKSSFLSTVAGKITVGVIGAVLIGGSVFGVSQVVQNNQDRSTPTASIQEGDETGTLSSETVPETVSGVTVETESELATEWESMIETELLLAETESETKLAVETESETTETETESESETETESGTETETIVETESEDTPAVQAVSDDEFPELLEGNLTKEEFQLVLAGMSDVSMDSELSVLDYCLIMRTLCYDSDENNVSLTVMGYREKSGISDRTEYEDIGYSVSEIDRLFSVFTDFRFDQGKFYSPIGGVTVDGDTLWIYNGTNSYTMTAFVTGASYMDDQLIIYFDSFQTYTDTETDEVTVYTSNRKAILKLNENGKYQISRIALADDWLEQMVNPEEETEEEEVQVQTITDDEYSALLEGNLTKEELEFVLARLNTGEVESIVSEYTYANYLRAFCWQENAPLEFLEKEEDGRYSFDLNEVNRLFSVLTDYQFAEGDDENSDYYIIGDSIWLSYCLFHDTADAAINAACVDGDTMVVSYTYHCISDSAQTPGLILGDLTETRIAVLEKDENGLFRIVYNQADYTVSKVYPELAAVIKALSSVQPDEEETAGSETDTLAETEIQTELQTELQTEIQSETTAAPEAAVQSESEQILIIGADLEAESEAESESEAEDLSAVQTVTDDQYPDLLEGALTKAELEFVLTFGPEEMSENGLTEQEFYDVLTIFCSAYNEPTFPLTYLGYNSGYGSMFLADGFDRLFSVFTDFRVTEDNDRNAAHGVTLDGNTFSLYPVTLSYDSSVAITEALYSEDKMILYYDYYREYMPEAEAEDFTVSKAAVLKKNANGNFQIVRITDAASVSTDELYAASETEAGSEEIVMIIGEDTGSTADTGMTDEIRALYEQVLQDVADGKYTFPSAAGCNIEGYYYFVTDMDSDCSPELIVGAWYTNDVDVFYWYDCLVFDVEAGTLVQISGDIELLSVFLPADGGCFYAKKWLQRGTGMAYIDEVTIQGGSLQSDYVYEMNIQDDAYTQFKESNPLVEWTEISDLTGMDNVQ